MVQNQNGQCAARGTPGVAQCWTLEKSKREHPGRTAARLRRAVNGLNKPLTACLNRTYEGRKPDKPRGCRVRFGTVNVGTMSKRSGEIVDMVARWKLDFCCVQETRWKGGSSRTMGKEGERYKFFWAGSDERGLAGVGVLVAERWIDKVIEVRRVSERVMVLRVVVGKTVVNLVSMYAPQAGRGIEEKEEFYASMCVVLAGIDPREELIVGGDMNGHTGRKADGFEEVHGGEGYGDRNMEGEMLLEFAVAMGLVVVNTWFRKDDKKKVTYESGDCRTVTDYVLMRQCDRKRVKDVRVIQDEPCIPSINW